MQVCRYAGPCQGNKGMTRLPQDDRSSFCFFQVSGSARSLCAHFFSCAGSRAATPIVSSFARSLSLLANYLYALCGPAPPPASPPLPSPPTHYFHSSLVAIPVKVGPHHFHGVPSDFNPRDHGPWEEVSTRQRCVCAVPRMPQRQRYSSSFPVVYRFEKIAPAQRAGFDLVSRM